MNNKLKYDMYGKVIKEPSSSQSSSRINTQEIVEKPNIMYSPGELNKFIDSIEIEAPSESFALKEKKKKSGGKKKSPLTSP